MGTSIGEIVGTVTLEDRFSSALEMVARRSETLINRIEGSFGAAALGATALGAAVVGLAGTVIALGVAGSKLNDIENGFNRVAGSAENATKIFDAMNVALKGAVDDDFIRQFASKSLSTGAIKTAEDFGTVAKAARSLARDGFGPVENMMGQIQSAMTTGRVRSLQYLTGVIDLKGAEEKYAKSLGVTREQLSTQGKLHADQIAILDKLNSRLKTAGEAQTAFAEKISAANVWLQNWFEGIEQAVAKSPNVNRALDAIGEAFMRNFGGGVATAQDVVINWINRFADGVAYYGPMIMDWISKVVEGVKEIWHSVTEAWDLVPDWFKNIAKDAAFAGGAVLLASKVIKAATEGESGHAGSGIFEKAVGGAEIATGLGHTMEIFHLATKSIKSFSLELSTMEKVGGGAVGYFKNLGTVLASMTGLSKLAGLGGWMKNFVASTALVYQLGGVSGIIEAIGVGITDLVAGSALLTGAVWVAVAYGIYKVGDAIHEMYKAYKDTGDMWSYFKKGGAFWDNSFIGRLLGMSKELNTVKDAMNARPKITKDIELLPERLQWTPMPEPDPSDTDDKAKEIEKATLESIKRTRGLWDGYYTEVEKGSTDLLQVALANIDRRFASEKATLDESKKVNANYWNELTAMYAKRAEEIANAQKEATMRNLRQGMEAMAKAIEDAFDAPEKAPLFGKVLKGLPPQLKDIETAAGRASAFIEDAMNKAAKSVLPLSDENRKLAISMAAVGASAQQIADTLHVPIEQVQRFTKESDRLTSSLDVLAEGFQQLSQIGGTSVSAFVRGMGQMVSVTNTAVKAMKSLEAAQKAGSAGFSDYFSAGMSIANIAITGVSLLSDWLSRAAKLQQELFAYKVSSTAVDTMNALTQATMGYSKALIDAVMNAKTLAEAQNAMSKVDEAAKMAQEASSKFGPSTGDLITQYEEAKTLYDFMVKTGVYTADQLKAAWDEVEKAARRAGGYGQPKAGADVRTEADRIAQEMEDQAKDAGYQTQEALQKAADKAEKLYEYMRDSGVYTAEQVEDAFKRAQDAMNTAYGINTEAMKKMKSEFETLQKAVDAEAPEAVMGSIEKAQRTRMDDLKKQMEAEQDKIAKAQEAAAEKNGKATGKAIVDGFNEAFKVGGGGAIDPFGGDFRTNVNNAGVIINTEMDKSGTAVTKTFNIVTKDMYDQFAKSAQDAAYQVPKAFEGIEIRIPIHFDYDRIEQPEGDGLPRRQMALGGVGYATGPMDFHTNGGEGYLFTGEGKSFADVFGKAEQPTETSKATSTTLVIKKLQVGKEISVKDIVVTEFEKNPNSRDAKVLTGVLRAKR